MKKNYNALFLSKVRESLGLSIGKLSKKLDISRPTCSEICRGIYDCKNGPIFKKIVEKLRLIGISNAEQFLLPGSIEDPVLIVINKLNLKEVPPMNKNGLNYYGLTKDPFKSPEVNPHNIFINDENQEIIDTVLEAAHTSRFLAVVGNVGSGKSTLFNHLKSLLKDHSKMKCAFIPPLVTKHLTDKALISKLLREIGEENPLNDIDERATQLADTISELQENEYRITILIDDAHQLPIEGWRGLKIIAESCPSISVIFFAQPRIDEIISKTELLEVKRRLEIYHLFSFSLKQNDYHDLKAYIQHKLIQAGHKTGDIFPDAVIKKIGTLSSTPLDVNNICKFLLVKAEKIKEPFEELINCIPMDEINPMN